MYVIEVPVVSTVHLTRRTYLRCEFEISNKERCGTLQFAPHVDAPESIWLYVPSEDDEDDPADLRALFAWARSRDYQYIRLDGEIGDVSHFLPTYEETWE